MSGRELGAVVSQDPMLNRLLPNLLTLNVVSNDAESTFSTGHMVRRMIY